MPDSLQRNFPATRWSLVSRVRGGSEAEARDALRELFEKYREPLLFALSAWVRSHGKDDAERARSGAEDALQEVFMRFVESPETLTACRGEGKLRWFLKTCLQNAIKNVWRDQGRQKRGGGVAHVPLDALGAEPHDLETPDRILDRRLAWQLLDEAQAKVAEQATEEELAVFRLYLAGKKAPAIAEELGLTVKEVQNSIRRTRERLRAVLRGLVADTVADPAECEEELLQLLEDALPRVGR